MKCRGETHTVYLFTDFSFLWYCSSPWHWTIISSWFYGLHWQGVQVSLSHITHHCLDQITTGVLLSDWLVFELPDCDWMFQHGFFLFQISYANLGIFTRHDLKHEPHPKFPSFVYFFYRPCRRTKWMLLSTNKVTGVKFTFGMNHWNSQWLALNSEG